MNSQIKQKNIFHIMIAYKTLLFLGVFVFFGALFMFGPRLWQDSQSKVLGLLPQASQAQAAVRTWTGATNGSWSNAGNWGGTAPVTGDDLVFPGGASNLSNTNDLTENTIINSITLSGSGYTLSGNKLILGAGLAGITDSVASGGNTIALDIRLDVTRDITVTNTAETLTISGRIAGVGGLNKEGTGTLALSGANSYGGITKINVGVINASNSRSLGTIGAGTEVVGGAALELQGNISISYEALALRGYGVSNGGALRNISDNNTFGGLITLSSAGGTEIASDSGTLTITGGTTGNAPLIFDGAGDMVFSTTPLAGSGAITKNGAGTVTYNFPNTNTGLLTINAGTILYGVDNAILSGAITVTGGTLDIATFSDMVGTVTLGTLDLASGTITGTSGLLSSSTWTVYQGTISAVIGGNGGALTKSTTGTVVLTRPNLYTGATAINAGILEIQDSTSLGLIDGITTVTAGATLQINGDGLSIPEYITFSGTGHLYTGAIRNRTGDNTLTGLLTLGTVPMIMSDTGTTLTIDGKGLSATTVGLTVGGEGNTTFTSTAPIYGTTAALTKNDTGTLTIQSVSNYTGATIVNRGTLLINYDGAITNSAVTINAGGTYTVDNTADSALNRMSESALTMNGGNFNYIGNGTKSTAESTGALTLSSGHNIVTVTPGAGGSTTMTFASLSRTAGASVLFRGTSLGSNPAPNVSTIMFTAAPTLTGAAGSANSTTISVIKGAFGDSSLSGGGSDMVTYNVGNTNGLRLLNGAGFAGEYSATLTTNTNVKLTADVAASTVSINSLILNGFGITNPGGASTITMSSGSLAGNILANSATNIAGANTTLGIGTTELNIHTTANSTITAIIGTAVAGSLTISGTGNITLSAASAYTGTTTINRATLTYGASDVLSSGGITVGNGTLDIATFSDTVGAVTLQNGIITGSSGVLAGTSYSLREGTVSAILGGGSAAVTRVTTNAPANSVVTLTRDNTYTGATTISSGILKLGANGGGTNTPLGTTGGATTVTSGAALDLNGYTLGTAEGLTINGLGFGPGTTVANGNSNMGALMNSGGTATYSGAIALGAAARINADAGALTLTGDASGNFALTFGGFSDITYSGVRSGTSTIVKDGINTLTLSNGSSSYSGATTISVGTVKVGAVSVGGTNSPLGTTAGATTVALGSRLDLNGFNLGIAEPLTLNGVGYGIGNGSSGALINSSGSSVTFTGPLTLGSSSTIKADSGDVNLTSGTAMTGTGFTLTLGGIGNGSITSAINTSTSGAVTKIDTGTWTLSATNSNYTGAVSIFLGTLKLGANGATNSAFGTSAGGVVVYTGAVLDFNTFTIPTAEALTINGRGISNGGAFIGSSGTFPGTIAQGTDSRITNASGTLTVSGAVTGAFNLIVGGAGNTTFSVATGTAGLSLTKQGAGTLTVTGTNTHTGATRVEAGTLAYAGTTTLAATPLTVLGGTFNSGANADTIGTVTLIGGTITNSAALTAATSYTLESGTISGIIAGAIPVVKNTNNTVIWTGVNTISSTTTINAGTLQISGSGSAVSTTITVNLGGTLTLDNTSTAVASRLGDAIALTMNGGNFNFIGNTAAGASETTGALTLSTGHNVVTVTPGAGGSTVMTFASFARTAGATVLFRGTNLGNASAANVSTLVFTTTTGILTGAGGASGSTTVSIIKGAFGDTSLSGTGSDMVTYQGGTGLRLLNGGGFSNEYSATLTTNTNVKLTGNVAASTVSINSLILNGFGVTNPGGAVTTTISSGSLAGNILINSANDIAGANTTLGITTTELTVLATANSTISAIVGTAAAGSLTLSGTGNVTMSAANPYTSTTFINGATLTYSASNVLSSGGVTMRGGLYNLNGNSDTIGALTLTAGTVTTGAGTITLGSDLTTIANGNTASLVTGNLGLGANRIFNIGDGLMDNDAIISAVISGGFTVTKSTGAGVLVFSNSNTYTGATTISAGILRLGTAGGGTNTPLGTTAAGTTVGTGAGLDLNGFTLGTAEGLTLNSVLATGALQNTSSTAVDYSGLIVLTASSFIISNYGDINITNTGNITGTGFTLTIGGVGNGTLSSNLNTSTAGALTKNGLGQWTIGTASSETSNFTGLVTISAGTLKLGSDGSGSNTPLGTVAGGITITSGAMLDLNGFTLTTAEPIGSLNGTGLANKGALFNSSDNSISFTGAITLGAASRVVNYGSGVLTLTGAISGNFGLTLVTVGGITQSTASVRSGNGSATIIKEGSGTLILSGQNSMTAAITVSTGVLQLGADGGATNTPLGTIAGGVTVSAGAVLDLSTFTAGGSSTWEPLTLAGSGIGNGGALISNSAAGSTFATLAQTTSKIVNNGAGTLTIAGIVTGASAFWVGGSGNTTISGQINQTAILITKFGAGTLTLSNATNTVTSLVRINAGTLAYGVADALVTGPVTVAGGTLNLNGFNETNIGAVTLIDGSIVNTGGAATLTSTATYTLEKGTISAVLGSAVAAGIAKNTAGQVILSGDNTFTSTSIALNAGYLNLRHNNALGAAGTSLTTTISGGATLELENSITLPSTKAITANGTGVGKIGAIRSVNGSNTISANITLGTTNVRINSDAGSLTVPSVSGNTFNTIFGGAGSTTVSGAIGTTSGSVTKDGAGALSLPGNNTYTGPTTIILGTVVANSTASIGNGSATNTLILNGGTLQATGTITSGATRTVTLGYDGGTLDTNGNAISIAGTIGYVGGLTKAGPGTLTVTGVTTVGRNFAISNGTFVAPASMTVNGDFSNSGTFTHNSGTVTMTPTTSNTTASILGTSDTVFNNFTNTTPGSTLKFKEGNTYSFSGALTITGVDGNPVSMVSVTPASQWNMVVNTYSLTWLNIQDSNCSGATGVNDGNATIVGIGGNSGVCWTFVEITLGAGGDASEGGAGSGGAGAGGGGSGGGAGGSGGGAGSGGAGSGGAGSITEVGSGSQRASHPGPGGVQPLAYPGSVTAGNLLVVAGGQYTDGGGPFPDTSVSDTVGTTYTVFETPATNGRAWIAYGIAAGSGANTVTVTTGSYTSFSIDEFTGVDPTPLDVNGGDATGSSDTPSDNITTTVTNALIIGSMTHLNGSPSITPGNGFTQIGENEDNGSSQASAQEFKLAGAAGSYTVSWTLGSASTFIMQTVSFKPAGGSSGAGGGGGGSP